jgi:hypothetical protein
MMFGARGWVTAMVVAAVVVCEARALTAVEPFEEGGPAGEHTRLPAPEPFTLSARDAVTAIALLRRVGFLSVIDSSTDSMVTVALREVWAEFRGLDESYPLGHHRRFDLVVNGQHIDWDRTYIRYDGRQLFLCRLFTYRN